MIWCECLSVSHVPCVDSRCGTGTHIERAHTMKSRAIQLYPNSLRWDRRRPQWIVSTHTKWQQTHPIIYANVNDFIGNCYLTFCTTTAVSIPNGNSYAGVNCRCKNVIANDVQHTKCVARQKCVQIIPFWVPGAAPNFKQMHDKFTR